MTTNPFYNAGAATLYIVLVVSLMTLVSNWAVQQPEDNFLMPVGMISLFVVSAAIMGYIVLYQPIIMLLDGKRSEAVKLFIQTLAILAMVTVVVILAAFTLFR